MRVSVTYLFESDKRLSGYAVRTQVPAVGWLLIAPAERALRQSKVARLVDDAGADLLPWLEHAEVAEVKGQAGMLVTGVQYRKKGRKHSIGDRQAWWCEAPPRIEPIIDHAARIRAAEAEFERRTSAELQERTAP